MSPAGLWAYGAVAVILLLVSVYLSLLLRGAANERVIGEAIMAMLAARQRRDIPPQRQLLRAVVETLAAQERAAARVAAAVHEPRSPGATAADPSSLVDELLALPEPQSLVTEFFAQYAGDAGSVSTFAAFAGQLVWAETSRLYADLPDETTPALHQLQALAMEGRIAPVALAALDMLCEPFQERMPSITDTRPRSVEDVVRGLESATRRQMRLAVLLHSQAAAILRLRRVARGAGIGALARSWLRRRTPDNPNGDGDGDGSGHRAASLRLVVHRLFAAPRLKLRQVPFRQADLDSLEVVFDAIGEAMGSARECLAAGDPTRSLYLLTGISVPVPSGLPGRLYNQDSLTQVRALVAVGVWHRLAVCRWAGAAMDRAVLRTGRPGRAGLLDAAGDKREGS